MEFVLFSMFQIDVRNLVTNKLYICKEWHIQPSEVDRMMFFEYEWILMEINKNVKEQEKKNKEEEKKYSEMQKSMPNYNAMARNYSNAGYRMPSMPSMGNFRMPKI